MGERPAVRYLDGPFSRPGLSLLHRVPLLSIKSVGQRPPTALAGTNRLDILVGSPYGDVTPYSFLSFVVAKVLAPADPCFFSVKLTSTSWLPIPSSLFCSAC